MHFWCSFGAFAPKVHQKCTTFSQTAPKVAPCAKNAPKVHQKRHQNSTKSALGTGALLALLHQKSTKTAPVLWRSYWRFGNFGKKFGKISDFFAGSEKFPKMFRIFFQISSNPARALVQFWCSFGAKAPKVNQALMHFCFGEIRQARKTARHSDPRPRPLQLVEDLFWGVALQLPQELSALGISVGPRPRSGVQSLAHSCAP